MLLHFTVLLHAKARVIATLILSNFKSPQDGTAKQTIKEYYTGQEKKVKTVKDQVYSSLEGTQGIFKGSD